MPYIIIALVVIVIIYTIFSSLAEAVGGWFHLLSIIAILCVAFFAFGWKGIFGVIAACIAGYIVTRIGKKLSVELHAHDQAKIKAAVVKQQTEKDKQAHANDTALMNELDRNCFFLGKMDSKKWKEKLPNYVNREYTTSFEGITRNFAKQCEQQRILQNDEWFEPFKRYVLEHPQGTTVTKMLEEVSCPQLNITHITPDGDLVNTLLVKGTKDDKATMGVPPIFKIGTKVMNPEGSYELLFQPTPYLEKLYNKQTDSIASPGEELDFDSL